MIKHCSACGQALKDGDEIIAAVVSRFNQIASRVVFSIAAPTGCLDIQHRDCWEDFERRGDLGGMA